VWKKNEFVGRLSMLGFELCQLLGASSVGMIRPQGTLQMFGG
jgi:hypothetical protein